MLIGVFVFATAYKLNKKKRAATGPKKATAASGAGVGVGGSDASFAPIPLPGFPGMKSGPTGGADKPEKEDGSKK